MYHFTCIHLKIFKAIFVLETRIHTGILENFQVPSYWRWSPLLKSGSFSNEPPYSRTPLIQDSRVSGWQFLITHPDRIRVSIGPATSLIRGQKRRKEKGCKYISKMFLRPSKKRRIKLNTYHLNPKS